MNCPNWPTRVLVAALILASGAACNKRLDSANPPGPDSTTLHKQGDEKSWPVYEVRAEKFALALPPDWRQIDMRAEGFESRLQETLKLNPEYGAALGSLRQQAASGIKFFAFDPASVRSVNSTNVNVLHVTLLGEMTLAKFAADTLKKQEVTPTIAEPITHERLRMAYVECERLNYRMSMKTPSGKETTLAMEQYLAIRGKDLFIMTLGTPQEQESKYAGLFERIGQSFKIDD